MQHILNIIGGEWVIIIFVALVLILGTNRLPEAARKLGRAASEYNRAKGEIQGGTDGGHDIRVDGPVQNERQKLEAISVSLGISHAGKTTDELRDIIAERIGGKKPDA